MFRYAEGTKVYGNFRNFDSTTEDVLATRYYAPGD